MQNAQLALPLFRPSPPPGPSPSRIGRRPRTSSPPSARSTPSSMRSGRPRRRRSKPWPDSAASAPWRFDDAPRVPSPGNTRTLSWQALGEELKALLTPEEYDSAKRTTFNAFYTSPTVMQAIHEAIARLGVPARRHGPRTRLRHRQFHEPWPRRAMRFIGVELDSISGRIARALHPGQDIRIENFRDTRLPAARRGDRQRPLRRREAGAPRAALLPARLLLRQVG